MDVFFLLVFLAFLFVMSIGGLLYWAVMSGQFDDSDGNASVILQDDDAAFRGAEKRRTERLAPGLLPGRSGQSNSVRKKRLEDKTVVFLNKA